MIIKIIILKILSCDETSLRDPLLAQLVLKISKSNTESELPYNVITLVVDSEKLNKNSLFGN